MKLRTLVGAVVVITTTAGCFANPDGSVPNIFSDIGQASRAPAPGSADASPEQQRLRTQSEQYRDYAKTRLQSAGAGALIGGLLGAAMDSDNRGRGALIGAAAGGAIGYVAGSYLTRDHAQFVASSETLEQDIQVANELTASSQQNVQVAQAALDYQQAEITRLNEQYAAGQTDAETYERELASIAQDQESVRSMITSTEERVDKMEDSIAAYQQAGYDTAQLEAAIAAQERDLANLRRIEEEMVELISDAPEGVARPAIA